MPRTSLVGSPLSVVACWEHGEPESRHGCSLEAQETQPSTAGHRAAKLGATGLFQWEALEQLFKEHGHAHDSSCPLTTGWGRCPPLAPHCSALTSSPACTKPLPLGTPPCFPGRGGLALSLGTSYQAISTVRSLLPVLPISHLYSFCPTGTRH